ncbi:hypothetical protein Tco_0687294 [Tanacetum coccineum]
MEAGKISGRVGGYSEEEGTKGGKTEEGEEREDHGGKSQSWIRKEGSRREVRNERGYEIERLGSEEGRGVDKEGGGRGGKGLEEAVGKKPRGEEEKEQERGRGQEGVREGREYRHDDIGSKRAKGKLEQKGRDRKGEV